MKKSDFTSLRDYVLATNSYFECGFGLAYPSFDSNALVVDEVAVFPNDKFGDYFFFVPAGAISHARRDKTSYEDGTRFSIVSVVNNADPFVLSRNIRETLALFKGDMKLFASASHIHTVDNVANLLRSFDNDVTERFLTRIRKTVITITDVEAAKTTFLNGCINPIC